VPKLLVTPGMQDGVRGTSSSCGGDSAKQVAGNVDKSEAPTFLRELIEIRLDENLHGLFAGINLDTNRRVAEIDLMASSVRSSNDGVGHIISLERGQRRFHATFVRFHPKETFWLYSLERSGRLDQGSHSEQPRPHERTTLFPYCAGQNGGAAERLITCGCVHLIETNSTTCSTLVYPPRVAEDS
jgi:hypothetical protein